MQFTSVYSERRRSSVDEFLALVGLSGATADVRAVAEEWLQCLELDVNTAAVLYHENGGADFVEMLERRSAAGASAPAQFSGLLQRAPVAAPRPPTQSPAPYAIPEAALRNMITLQSTFGTYLSRDAQPRTGRAVMSQQPYTFWIEDVAITNGKVALRLSNVDSLYLCAERPDNNLARGSMTFQPHCRQWECFWLESAPNGRLKLKTAHNTYVAACSDGACESLEGVVSG